MIRRLFRLVAALTLTLLCAIAVTSVGAGTIPRCDERSSSYERIHLRLAIVRGTATAEERAEYEAMQHAIAACEEDKKRLRQENDAKIHAMMAKTKAELARLEKIPLQHTWISTWTDTRGVAHRRTTTCLFYQSRTECHSH